METAGRAGKIIGETLTAAAHPPNHSGGIAEGQPMIGNVTGNDSPGADKCVAADRHPANDGRICADGCTFSHEGWAQLTHLGNLGPWIIYIGKYH